MKQIVAVVKPYKLDDIRDAMEGVGIDSFTYGEVRGIGHHKGERDIYRGLEYAPSGVGAPPRPWRRSRPTPRPAAASSDRPG